jgi:hypothetical protein
MGVGFFSPASTQPRICLNRENERVTVPVPVAQLDQHITGGRGTPFEGKPLAYTRVQLPGVWASQIIAFARAKGFSVVGGR